MDIKAFFQDKNKQTVIYQSPNELILLWFVLYFVSSLMWEGAIKNLLSILALMSLVAWSFLELTLGASGFRRFLGAIVLLLAIYQSFNIL